MNELDNGGDKIWMNLIMTSCRDETNEWCLYMGNHLAEGGKFPPVSTRLVNHHDSAWVIDDKKL